jgi:hypothetical protein
MPWAPKGNSSRVCTAPAASGISIDKWLWALVGSSLDMTCPTIQATGSHRDPTGFRLLSYPDLGLYQAKIPLALPVMPNMRICSA